MPKINAEQFETLNTRVETLETRLAIEQRELESAKKGLLQADSLLRQMMSSVVDLLAILDLSCHYWMLSSSHQQILGYSEEELEGKSFYEFIAPKEKHLVEEIFEQSLKNLSTEFVTHQMLQLTGHWISIETSIGVLKNIEGDAVGFVISSRDISLRQTAQTMILERELQLRRITDNMVDMISEITSDWKFSYVSPSHNTILGYSSHDLIGKDLRSFIHEFDQSLVEINLTQGRTEYRFRTAQAHWVWIESNIHPILDRTGKLSSVILASRDITNRRQVEEDLRINEERFRSLFSAMNEALSLHKVIRFNSLIDWQIIDVNPAFERLFNVTRMETVGKLGKDVLPHHVLVPKDVCLEVIETGNPQRIESFFTSIQKFLSISIFRPSIDSFAIIFEDRTKSYLMEQEQTQIEAKMAATQKLESLGVLAGGIAHDFNNILTGILGNASLVLEELPENFTDLQTYVKEIIHSSMRAADLAKQMLAYAGKASFSVKLINLSTVTKEIGQLVESSISKKARLTFDLQSNISLIKADPTQIRQIVMNLIINASEALNDQPGQIIVKITQEILEKEDIFSMQFALDIPAGEYIILQVIDSGIGMSEDTKKRIFEPFFTTKFTGRGLGLSAVLGIVKGHQGAIGVQSQLGWGTRFIIAFPVAKDKNYQTIPPPHLQWRGQGHILIVDDENAVLQAAQRILQRVGFHVTTAHNGFEALQLIQHTSHYCCILLDLTMPTMDGEEALIKLSEIAPQIPIIISSGYHESEVIQRLHGKKISGFIQKPYQYQSLIQKVHDVIQTQDKNKPNKT